MPRHHVLKTAKPRKKSSATASRDLSSSRSASIATSKVACPAIIHEADWASLESARAETAQRLAAAPHLLPDEARHLAFYQSAFTTEGLAAYADAIPPEE